MIVQRDKQKMVKKMEEYQTKKISEVLADLSLRRYMTNQERRVAVSRNEPVPIVLFISEQGILTKAWRSKHAVHMRAHGTSVRSTCSWSIREALSLTDDLFVDDEGNVINPAKEESE